MLNDNGMRERKMKMKKIVGLILTICFICVFLICGCSQAQAIQEAIGNKDFGMARTQIEEIQGGSEKDEITENYEDALFAEAAPLLNDHRFIEADELGKQSISGKAQEAITHIILQYYVASLGDGFTAITNSTSSAMDMMNIDKSASMSAFSTFAEAFTPYIELNDEVPKDILPDEFSELHELAGTLFSDVYHVFAEIHNHIDENGQVDNEFNELFAKDSSSLSTISIMLQDLSQQYTGFAYQLPEEYKELITLPSIS